MKKLAALCLLALAGAWAAQPPGTAGAGAQRPGRARGGEATAGKRQVVACLDFAPAWSGYGYRVDATQGPLSRIEFYALGPRNSANIVYSFRDADFVENMVWLDPILVTVSETGKRRHDQSVPRAAQSHIACPGPWIAFPSRVYGIGSPDQQGLDAGRGAVLHRPVDRNMAVG